MGNRTLLHDVAVALPLFQQLPTSLRFGAEALQQAQSRAVKAMHWCAAVLLQVFAWTEQPDGTWQSKLVHNFGVPVWKVSWSVAGNILAVSDGNNAVSLWKETLDGVWQQVVQ